MALENFFTWLAIGFWVLLGALATLVLIMLIAYLNMRREKKYAPFAELLGKECELLNDGNPSVGHYRIVAVSHKGAVAVRKYGEDFDKGNGAFWIPKEKVPDRVRVVKSK